MSPVTPAQLADRFKTAFASLGPSRPMPVETLYDPDVVFQDPFHRIEGRDALAAYFARLNKNVASCTFTFHDTLLGPSSVALRWTMDLRVKRGPRAPIVVDGTSWLTVGTLAATHTDHFDAGAMLYEQIPGLSLLLRTLKRAL